MKNSNLLIGGLLLASAAAGFYFLMKKSKNQVASSVHPDFIRDPNLPSAKISLLPGTVIYTLKA